MIKTNTHNETMKDTGLKLTFSEYKEQVKRNLEQHVSEGGFDVEDVEIEDVINFPINILLPDSEGEWSDANVGGSETDDPVLIEVKYGYFYINDGHNRVKTAIASGDTHIKARIAYKK